MSRAQAVVDHLAKQGLIDAALEQFDERGYRGTSIRQIAARAGSTASGFYEHFRSKQAILLEIIDATYTAASAEVEAAVALAGDGPASRLEAAVWAQCEFQVRCQRACRVAGTELSHLPRGVDREDGAATWRRPAGAAGRGHEGIAEGADGVEGERAVRAWGVGQSREDGDLLAVGADAVDLVVRGMAVDVRGREPVRPG